MGDAPPPPAAPAIPTVSIPGDATPRSIYTAYDQQGKVLREQLEGVLDQRSEEIAKLTNIAGGDAFSTQVRAGIQARIATLDKRIAGLEEQIVAVDRQTAAAAGVPGAIVPPSRNSGGNDGENFAGGMATATAMIIIFLFMRRRFWRRGGINRGSQASSQLPAEITGRMERLENIAEATALEVERIGEGQRFVTKLLSEQQQKLPVK